eukprot:jgi/Tetstr1/442199/TSEL_030347.t2
MYKADVHSVRISATHINVLSDAFSKTIPIWACVINRAVAVWRRRAPPPAGGVAPTQSGAGWDTELHLPLWISAVERGSIEALLDGFVDRLLAMGVDMAALSSRLVKPLRPLWLSPASRIWINAVPHPTELGFLPLVLLSASAPVPASSAHQPDRRAARQHGGGGDGDGGRTFSFCYLPGGGDDEESWARGLTPALMWAHRAELVDAGPQGIAAVVDALVAGDGGDADPPATEGSLKTASSGGADNGPGAEPPGGGAPSPAVVDEHHPLPQGCAAPRLAASLSMAVSLRCSLSSGKASRCGKPWPIGSSGILLGSHACGRPPAAWATADAVLNCGVRQHAGMEGEGRDVPPGAPGGAALHRYRWLPVQSTKRERHSLARQLPAALGFLGAHLGLGRRVLVHCGDGFDVCVAVAVAALLSGLGGPGGLQVASAERGTSLDGAAQQSAPPRVTKDEVRRQLAAVCRFYPLARPSRGMLKQVYSHFQGGGGSDNAGDEGVRDGHNGR